MVPFHNSSHRVGKEEDGHISQAEVGRGGGGMKEVNNGRECCLL